MIEKPNRYNIGNIVIGDWPKTNACIQFHPTTYHCHEHLTKSNFFFNIFDPRTNLQDWTEHYKIKSNRYGCSFSSRNFIAKTKNSNRNHLKNQSSFISICYAPDKCLHLYVYIFIYVYMYMIWLFLLIRLAFIVTILEFYAPKLTNLKQHFSFDSKLKQTIQN